MSIIKDNASQKSQDIFIVIAHYNENYDWVKNISYPYQIISRQGVPRETKPNKGNEASSFLEYIIQNYENLHEYTLFVHAHRTSWHHKTNIDERINHLICDKPYYNINKLDIDKITIRNEEFIKMLEKICMIQYNRKNKHLYRAGAQFYVHKSLILRNSKSAYEECYNYLMNATEHSYSTGRYFEYSWHILFTHQCDDIE